MTDPKPLPGEVREPMPCPVCGVPLTAFAGFADAEKTKFWQTNVCCNREVDHDYAQPIHPARLAAEGLTRPSSPEADRDPIVEAIQRHLATWTMERDAYRELAEATQALWDRCRELDEGDVSLNYADREAAYEAAKSRHKSASAAVGELKGIV